MPAHSKNVSRYTPLSIFEGLDTIFDLDPCAPEGEYPGGNWCENRYCLERGEDGLSLPWLGFIWLNPPWNRHEKGLWVGKLAAHKPGGIALVRAGTGSAWLQDHPPDALFLLRGRIKYLRGDGEQDRLRKGSVADPFEPSMLLGYGRRAADVLQHCTLEGMYCEVRS